MNPVKDKAIRVKRLLQGASRAFVTRASLVAENSDTKFRLLFRYKVSVLRTLHLLIRLRSDEWIYNHSEQIENRIEKLKGWAY